MYRNANQSRLVSLPRCWRAPRMAIGITMVMEVNRVEKDSSKTLMIIFLGNILLKSTLLVNRQQS
jgi:hypothetical protein